MSAPSADKARSCEEAEAYLQTRNYEAAITVYVTLVAAHPEDESLLLALAWAYHDAGHRNEAARCFEKLFERELVRKVFTGFAYDELVRLYKAHGQCDRLVDVCTRAAAAQPDDIALLTELSRAYLTAGKTSKAGTACRRALAMAPEETSLYCLLGEVHLAAGQFPAAEKAYRRAVRLEPEAAGSFFSRLAAGYDRLGEYQREEATLRRCLQLFPHDPLFYCRMGECLIKQGQLNPAAAAYERAMALSPDSADAFRHRWGNALAADRKPAATICPLPA